MTQALQTTKLGSRLSDKSEQFDWMPWAWCNLRRNPFGELSREERPEVAVVDVQAITDLVSSNHQAVQLIGGCGRGKTTRMLVLHRELPESTYAYLSEFEPCPSIAAGSPVLIDEAQRLPRKIRKRVFASGLPLVLATHKDLTRPLKRAGYHVVTFHIGETNSPDLVCEALNRRIVASAIDSNCEVPALSLDDATTLVARFGSDIRAIEGYLYDVVQAQTFQNKNSDLRESADGKMRFID